MTREQLIETRWLLKKWCEEQDEKEINARHSLWGEAIVDIIDSEIENKEE